MSPLVALKRCDLYKTRAFAIDLRLRLEEAAI